MNKIKKFLNKIKNSSKEKKLSFLAICFILLVYLSFSVYKINEPFIHVSSDNNALYGLSVKNLLESDFDLKFGFVTGIITDESQINYYTHHPHFFILPTMFFYKFFGINDVTTRLGPISFMVLGILALYFSLRKNFKEEKSLAFFSTLIFVIFPGVIFYGKTFELAIFCVPAGLITYYFFIKYLDENTNKNLYYFLSSVILGGFMGWFYYLLPVSIWFYVLFLKKDKYPQKYKILFLLPLVSIFVFALNFLHFYYLKGDAMWLDMKNQFFSRTARQPFISWFQRIFSMIKLHTSSLFLVLAAIGLSIIPFLKEKQKYLNLIPLFVWSILVFTVFNQWSTHPYGVIYLWPILAIFVGITFSSFYNLKNKVLGLILIVVLLFLSLFTSWQNQKYFYNEFLILAKPDIELLKELKPQVDHNEVCLGKNQLGLGFTPIIEWYLEKKVSGFSNCVDSEDTKVIIIFHPDMGKFYLDQATYLQNKGFKLVGCTGGFWCLLEKVSN